MSPASDLGLRASIKVSAAGGKGMLVMAAVQQHRQLKVTRSLWPWCLRFKARYLIISPVNKI